MADLMINISLSAMVLALVAISIVLRVRLKQAEETIALQDDNNMLLLDEIAKSQDREASLKLEKTDGFVKFLSESRDWAFSYIEDVQKSIQGLINAMSINDKAKILEYYNELQRFLPEEENNKEKK
jgi:molecular chaperone DnaK (HSP70)